MHISRILPCLILWFLWAERNNSRHNETRFLARNVIWQAQMHIQNLSARGLIGVRNWSGCNSDATGRVRVEERRAVPLPRSIKWYPPEDPWIKLNTKGIFSEETGQAAGGGIIRNAEGRLIKAFALPLPSQPRSQLEAKIQEAALALSSAQQHGSDIWLELDSAQAAAILQREEPRPASTRQSYHSNQDAEQGYQP